MKIVPGILLGVFISATTFAGPFTSPNLPTLKPPYLSVSNSSDWDVTVFYTTESEPEGSMMVKRNTITGMPIFDMGEKVQLINFLFTNGPAVLSLPSFENWCSNISFKQIYNEIDVQVTQDGDHVKVTCSGK